MKEEQLQSFIEGLYDQARNYKRLSSHEAGITIRNDSDAIMWSVAVFKVATLLEAFKVWCEKEKPVDEFFKEHLIRKW